MNGRMLATRHPARRLRGEMDRLIDEVFGDFFGPTWFDRGFGPGFGTRSRTMPALNVWEDDANLYAELEVPGMNMDDLELTVMGNELSVRGQRKPFEQEGVTYHRRERETGNFSRVVRLPVEIDADRVEASLRHGVLTITLPKAETARPRKIEVKALNR